MAKPKPKRKAKRGPSKQALARLLKSNKHLTLTAKREFDAAHAKAMKSLALGDVQAFGESIKDEAAAIEKFSKVQLPRPKQ